MTEWPLALGASRPARLTDCEPSATLPGLRDRTLASRSLMAKQRRPQTRSSKAASGSPRQPQPLSASAPVPPAEVAPVLPAPSPKPQERRSTYVDAVALYEQGLNGFSGTTTAAPPKAWNPC